MDSNNNPQKEIDWTKGAFPAWAKMLVAVAIVLLMMLVFFRVRTFEASGNVHYTLEEIAEASGITEGDILMGVNKTSTASRLLVKLPYLEQVIIHKELPGTVRFEVRECTAAAIGESEFSTFWTMNEKGKLLEEVESPDEDSNSAYPVISGAYLTLPTGGDIAVYDDVYRGELAMRVLSAVLDTELLSKIDEINVEDTEDVYLLYDERIEVHLGSGDEAEYKLQYFKSVLSSLEDGVSGVMDLSFATGEKAIFHPLVS